MTTCVDGWNGGVGWSKLTLQRYKGRDANTSPSHIPGTIESSSPTQAFYRAVSKNDKRLEANATSLLSFLARRWEVYETCLLKPVQISFFRTERLSVERSRRLPAYSVRHFLVQI